MRTKSSNTRLNVAVEFPFPPTLAGESGGFSPKIRSTFNSYLPKPIKGYSLKKHPTDARARVVQEMN